MDESAGFVAKQNAEEYASAVLYKIKAMVDIEGLSTGIGLPWDLLKKLLLQAHTAGALYANRQMQIGLGMNPDEDQPPQEKP